ncbi:MAG: ATP-dependent DNA helicase UvrD2, partial [Paludibacteraceae bacterium]
FSKKLNELTEILKQSPAVTDSREKAKVYDEALMDVFTEVEKKKYWIKGVRNGFSVEKYFGLRKSFELPEIKISASSRNQTKKKISSKHPELMGMLFELRKFNVDETWMPIYLVANIKTIVEMAYYLQQTKSDLLKINGFG